MNTETKDRLIELAKSKIKKQSIFVMPDLFNKMEMILSLLKNQNILIVTPNKSEFNNWTLAMDKTKFSGTFELIDFTKFRSYILTGYESIIVQDINKLDYSLFGRFRVLNNVYAFASSIDKTKTKRLYDIGKLPTSFLYTIDDAVEDGLVSDYQINVHYLTLSKLHNIKQNNLYISEDTIHTEYDRGIFDLQHTLGHVDTKSGYTHMQLRSLKLKNKLTKRKTLLLGSFPRKLEYVKNLLKGDRKIVYTKLLDATNYFADNSKSLVERIEEFNLGVTKFLPFTELPNCNLTEVKRAVIHQLDVYDSNLIAKLFFKLDYNNKAKKSIIDIVGYSNTSDEVYINRFLKNFNSNKIKIIKK